MAAGSAYERNVDARGGAAVQCGGFVVVEVGVVVEIDPLEDGRPKNGGVVLRGELAVRRDHNRTEKQIVVSVVAELVMPDLENLQVRGDALERRHLALQVDVAIDVKDCRSGEGEVVALHREICEPVR